MTSHIDKTLEFSLSASDGTPLFVRDWPLSQADDKKPVHDGIVIMHGLGEHCGRYAHVARFFNALGFAVRTYDHRGHGASGGARGDSPDEESLLRDARLVINDFSKHLTAPPLLLGHSMGGLFAARFATAGLAPIRGLILSSPALALPMSGMQLALLKVASTLFPGLGVSNGLKTKYLSHDAEVIQAYINDTQVHSKISARLLNSMLASMEYAHDHAPQLKIPVLMIVAGDDHLVDPEGSQRFFVRLPEETAQAYFYDGFYHEIFNELEATRVFDDVRTWLVQRHFIAA
ncbi:alpha/beta hydrolase [Undibacterium sp. RTI2.1]|uniref:alpha/beta hydrolase n=1 Tax=unclassified Undibacterium TaxID=2630295 RepID=UPI002AB52127|nr:MULTISPECIES: alpha/beta hydrolase [unclassified Undibacterium]MDY7539414.1 alpha/beta hydrolase [Undibacterium sp. 5I1]MEB0029668.1 alpha/beta hydrolase [Undibacterium sp. RTI2.1]MEB0116139.1 alpha/beta hydrolase [Undibacterium sp. RTI2.2]MEB0231361.1 alpha/beta hydrolase [Undibacterium sp. 10I3]MEB0258361.1 alpha/beta hydrolase [Undibacterium sp. 5I1]